MVGGSRHTNHNKSGSSVHSILLWVTDAKHWFLTNLGGMYNSNIPLVYTCTKEGNARYWLGEHLEVYSVYQHGENEKEMQ